MRLSLLPAVAGLIATASSQAGPTVTTLNGTLQGARCLSTDVNSFLSIPYGKAPVGDLRFAAPQAWDEAFIGVRDATKAAPTCIQFNSDFSEKDKQTEDCLVLNVWVPANANPNSKLPVRVWLYGGANTGGGISNPLYDGCFASKTTLQVSVNYRLGPLGFLATNDVGLTGNYGLQDQLLALRWVQANIAAFGGDPTRVLLFGQSAGATDAWAISTLPQARGLLSAAVLQSTVPSLLPDLAAATTANAAFLSALRCTTLACLRAAPLYTVRAAAAAAALRASAAPGLGLVVDGAVVPAQPLDVALRVPAVVGTNTNEGSLFIVAALRLGAFELREAAYETFLNLTFADAAVRAAVRARYPWARFAGAPGNQAVAAMAAVGTDQRFRCPARRVLARAAAEGVRVWTYSFALTPSCPWEPRVPALPAVLAILGATHSAELAYVFGEVEGLPRPDGNCTFSAGDKAVSAAMVGAWDSMAASGEPGGGWPVYDVGGSMGVNMVNGTFAAGKVDYSMCDFWDSIEGQTTTGATGTGTGSGPARTSSGTPAATSPNVARAKHGVSSTGASVVGVAWLMSLLLSGTWAIT